MPALTRELIRELDRVADRLRVLGPRLEARAGGSADPALDDVRRVLQQLADLAADAEGSARRPVPRLAARALADQLLVLGHDVAQCGDDAAVEVAAAALIGLRRTL